MRPKKTRWIKCAPGERCFRPAKTATSSSRERAGSTDFRPAKTATSSSRERAGSTDFQPRCRPGKELQDVILTLDEFETLRLFDLQKLDQHAIALKMKVHRSTVSRILAAARTKIADALVNLKVIKVAGGCCVISSKKIKKRR